MNITKHMDLCGIEAVILHHAKAAAAIMVEGDAHADAAVQTANTAHRQRLEDKADATGSRFDSAIAKMVAAYRALGSRGMGAVDAVSVPAAEEDDGNERAAFDVWWQAERQRTWVASGCAKDRGPTPSAHWSANLEYDARRGWMARAALAAPGAAAAAPSQDAERLALIRKAIDGYHLALDGRQHGGIAASNAFDAIREAMGMPWVPGAAARAAHAQGGTS